MKKVLLTTALLALFILVLSTSAEAVFDPFSQLKDVGVTPEKGQWMECESWNFGEHNAGTHTGTGKPARVSSTDAWVLSIHGNTDFGTADGLYGFPVSNLQMSGNPVTMGVPANIAGGGPGEDMQPDIDWELKIPWDLPEAAYGQPMTAEVTYTLMPAL